MSTWHALAIERLGTPAVDWVSIFGPDAASVAALRTLDLTPNGMPMDTITQEMERDFLRSSMGQMALSLSDPDGSLAEQLGPASTLMATPTRYAGPWVQVSEVWSGGSAVRFLGYLDELTLQWDEMSATTTFTVYASAQLLAERHLTEIPSLLRPYPSVPGAAVPGFTATTADDALAALVAFTPRSNALALEEALWAVGSLTGGADVYRTFPDVGSKPVSLPCPPAPALTLQIGGATYAVASTSWNKSITAPGGDGDIFCPWQINLAGTPDLTGALSIGSSITWNTVEAILSHYVLAQDIPAPATGADGQTWAQLQAIGGLIPGDPLTVTYKDTSGKTATLGWTVIDLDGEKNRVNLKDPIQEALAISSVIRIRRNSQDPVLVDAIELLAQAVAPWPLDTTHLLPALTASPVLSWLPLASASPSLYGATDIQALDRSGKLRISRRGATDGTGLSPSSGVWEGTVGTGFSWSPSTDAAFPARQVGCLTQWPGGTNDVAPPSVWIEGDLSGGATIPPNGWRRMARGSDTWTDQVPAKISQTWDGTVIHWTSTSASGAIPTSLVHFSGQSASPGRYTLSGGAWTYEPHSGAGTLGSLVTVTPSGLPSGSPLLLGMGIYASSGVHQEALLAILATGAGPYTTTNAALVGIGSSGALTIRATAALTTPQAGPWSIGGGLVMCTYPETLSGVVYPHTRLWLLDGGAPVIADLETLEILPGTVQPLQLVSGRISGWLAMGLETYQDTDGRMQRRGRLVQLDGSLNVVNGSREPSPVAALDPSVAFSRGSLVSDPMISSGSILARMVRTGQGDRCVGLLGGRLFMVDAEVSTVLERVSLSGSGTTTVSNSLQGVVPASSKSGMTALDLLEQVGQALMATGIPMPDGSIALVSRRSGALRPAVPGSVEGHISVCPVGLWVGEVDVSYQDPISGNSTQTVSLPARSGGKVLSMDLSGVLCSPAQAQSVGDAAANHWGVPAGLRACTWTDGALGMQADLAPPFWASYQVGDRIPTGGKTYKLAKLAWSPEDRQATVELLEIPGGGA